MNGRAKRGHDAEGKSFGRNVGKSSTFNMKPSTIMAGLVPAIHAHADPSRLGSRFGFLRAPDASSE